MRKKKMWGLAALAAAGCLPAVRRRRRCLERREAVFQAAQDEAIAKRSYKDRRAYFIGGGLASMAGAAFLIRDCNFPASQITIYEKSSRPGGVMRSGGDEKKGFFSGGGRFFYQETYENFMELFGAVPSLRVPGLSVAEEMLGFCRRHPLFAGARLVDAKGRKANIKRMGLNRTDRRALFALMHTDERRLDHLRIDYWFKETPHIFETNFWYLWQSAFGLRKCSSLFELRRSLNRMLLFFPKLGTMEGALRTPLNPYESLIRPLETYLRKSGVAFRTNCRVADLTFREGAAIQVQSLTLEYQEEAEDGTVTRLTRREDLRAGDLCILTAAGMSAAASFADLDHAPESKEIDVKNLLWERVAEKIPGMGDPVPFFSRPEDSSGMSFCVTCRGRALMDAVEGFIGQAGAGAGLMTFKDSPWLLSMVIPTQPYFEKQPEDIFVLLGYGLCPEEKGNHVKKVMKACTGREVLFELFGYMGIEREKRETLMASVVNVRACYLPFMNAARQPRAYVDRPKPVPAGSVNFAVIGQFTHLNEDMAFGAEYGVRSAREAVCTLLDVKRHTRPVTPYNHRPGVWLRAIMKAYRKW